MTNKEKRALYFGYKNGGHFLYTPGMVCQYLEPRRVDPSFPWDIGLLDSGLLTNGKVADKYDGRVFWTCGGSPLWFGFFWWDNSGDKRGASNSGLYVRGFGHLETIPAFEYAKLMFPEVVSRQHYPLILQ